MTKHKLLLATLGLAVAVLVMLMWLYQFGPPGIKAGDDRILATTNLTDGSRLFIVAHRTEHLIETYEVTLYRVYLNKDVFVCFLGHQEAFWWGCKFRPTVASDDMQIRAFGGVLALYTVSDGNVTWSDGKRGGSPSYKIDGRNITWPIPKVILDTSH